jgi:hypothetical protein
MPDKAIRRVVVILNKEILLSCNNIAVTYFLTSFSSYAVVLTPGTSKLPATPLTLIKMYSRIIKTG